MKHGALTTLGCLLLFAPNIAISAELTIQPNTDVFTRPLIGRERIINPGVSAYGVPWHCTEEEMQEIIGPPSGMFMLENDAVVYLYGKSHTFVFTDGKFNEMKVSDTHSIFEFKLSKIIRENPFFDSSEWTVDPGIKCRSTFPQVETVFNQSSQLQLPPPDPENRSTSTIYYPNARVVLYWAKSSRSFDENHPYGRYILHSIQIHAE